MFQSAGDFSGKKTAAAHAGVHGEVRGEGFLVLGTEASEVVDFGKRREARGPAAQHDFLALFGEGGTEEKDGSLNAFVGEERGFVYVGDAEVGKVFVVEVLRESGEAMSVGPRFHDRHHLLARVAAGEGEVVVEGGEVDLGTSAGWGGHGVLIHRKEGAERKGFVCFNSNNGSRMGGFLIFFFNLARGAMLLKIARK